MVGVGKGCRREQQGVKKGSRGVKGERPRRAVVDGPVAMSSACRNHRRPPLASDADRRALHELGYLELPNVPEWELLAFCEKCATVGLNPD